METQAAREDPLARQLALSLGWFSIGLGVAELVAPRTMARLSGIREGERTESIVRAFGAREVGAGLAILMQPSSSTRVWSRVAGDALDLAYLGSAFGTGNPDQRRTAAATAAVAGITVLDVLVAQRLGRGRGDASSRRREARVVKAITINRPIDQVFAFWRRFENFPRFMRHLESVEALEGGRSRWRAKGPAGVPVEWLAQIVEERDQQLLAWRSLPGSDVDNRGRVRFEPAPGARGTELRVELEYRPPAGSLGRNIAWLFGAEPEQQLDEDLRRVKQILETGQVSLSEGPGLWRAAQPPTSPEQIRTLAGVDR